MTGQMGILTLGELKVNSRAQEMVYRMAQECLPAFTLADDTALHSRNQDNKRPLQESPSLSK